MSLAAQLIHVDRAVRLAVPYRGDGLWGVWWGSWRTLCPWPGSWSKAAPYGASGLRVERRRNPSELRNWAGRQKRRRRVVLAGWDRQARWKARERGRERAQTAAR